MTTLNLNILYLHANIEAQVGGDTGIVDEDVNLGIEKLCR